MTEIVNPPIFLQEQVLEIAEIDFDRRQAWDEFVERHPNGTMYHLYGWKTVLEKTFGYKSYYLAALNDKEIVGVLSVFVMMDIFRKKYLVSNPFSNFAGLCTNDPEAGKKLLMHVFEIAHTENAQYVELRQLRQPIDNQLVQPSLPTKESFVTLILDVKDGSENIWNGLSSRNRGKVRKARKSGLKVDFGKNFLDEFYSVLAVNLKYLGTPVHPISFYENIIAEFPERVELLNLTLNDKVVSSMFLFRFREMLSEPWVASLREYNRIYVNNLLYWEAIEYACEHDFSTFDFGRSTVDAGTFNFKMQWGAKPVQLYYHYYLNLADKIPVVDAVNNEYERYIEIWKKLPLSLTKFAGPRLVKYLPEL